MIEFALINLRKIKMNSEQMIVSLLFFNKANIEDYLLKREMFTNKSLFDYIEYLQTNITSGITQAELSQNYIALNNLQVYDIEYIEKQLTLYRVETLFEMFYTLSIDNIWREYNNSNKETKSLSETYKKIEEIKNIISEIEKEKEVKNPFEQYRIQLEELKEQRENGLAQEGIIGLRTGIEKIDIITGGMKPGEYVIIGGRPSIGKTSLALDIGIENIKSNKHVLICSVEMTSEQIVARAIPKVNSTLTLAHSVYGENLEERLEDLFEATKFLEDSGLEIEDFSNNTKVTALDIQKAIRAYFNKYGFYPDLVIIDYIQKIQSISNNRVSENEIVTEVSNMIQRLGKSTKSVFLVLSQLNRSLEDRVDKRPMNSDLRNSGALEQDADIIMFVYRESIYLLRSLKEKLTKNPASEETAEAIRFLEEAVIDAAEVIVAKNRSGKIGTANIDFHKPTASYMDCADYIEESIEL